MINRAITNQIKKDIRPGNVTILFGARRTGKTFLMNHVISDLSESEILVLNGEDIEVMGILSSGSQTILKNLVKGYKYLLVDEAQNIPNIGKNLKLLIDTNPDIAVFATGSASFDLRNMLGEPLTGRSRFYNLYPFSFSEICNDYITFKKNTPTYLIYGFYPQVYLEENLSEKRSILENLKNGYLLKDILMLDNLKNSIFILDLLKLLAYQIGNDISYNELAISLKTTVKTIQRYTDLLEKTFIIFRLNGYSKNLRKEISKSPRFYFWDNGIRNAVISDFRSPNMRDDLGKLWENFCISEKIKKEIYKQSYCNFYFWRTYDQQEIDLIEECNGNLNAFEIKWGDKIAKIPVGFKNNYSNYNFQTINQENIFDFLN